MKCTQNNCRRNFCMECVVPAQTMGGDQGIYWCRPCRQYVEEHMCCAVL